MYTANLLSQLLNILGWMVTQPTHHTALHSGALALCGVILNLSNLLLCGSKTPQESAQLSVISKCDKGRALLVEEGGRQESHSSDLSSCIYV